MITRGNDDLYNVGHMMASQVMNVLSEKGLLMHGNVI